MSGIWEHNIWVQIIFLAFIPWMSYLTCVLFYLFHYVAILNHMEYILELLEWCLVVSNIQLLIISYCFLVNITESYPNILLD